MRENFQNIQEHCNLHIKGEFQLCVSVRVIDLEESMDELFEIYVSILVQVKHCEEALTNDTRELGILKKESGVIAHNFDRVSTYAEDAHFVDSLRLSIRLSCQVLVDVLEIRDSDVLLELFI